RDATVTGVQTCALPISERIGGIVRSLQHIARDGTGDAPAPASMRDMIGQAIDLCRERCRMHSIRLDTPEIDPELRVYCRQVPIRSEERRVGNERVRSGR